MRTLAISNLKGGVGKTTTAFNLGAALAELGHTVLMIDADPQGSLTDSLGIAPASRQSLADVLRGQATIGTAAIRTTLPGLWAVASSPALEEINRRNLAGERVLLARMPQTCDFTLIDCPADVGVVLYNALVAAEEVLCPVQARGLSTAGVARLLGVMGQLRSRGINPSLDLLGILVNQYDQRTRIARGVLRDLRTSYGPLVLQSVIHDSVRLAESTDARTPVTRMAPDSRAAIEIQAIAREVVQRTAARQGYFGRGLHRDERRGLAVVGEAPAARSALRTGF